MDEHDIQQRLAQFIEQETEYWDFWGAIRIVKSGNTLWETSRGYACAEFGVKNTVATRFTIASVTIHLSAGMRSKAIRTISYRKALRNQRCGDMN